MFSTCLKSSHFIFQNEHNPDACSKSGFTPLHIAAHYGNVAVAKALLAAGADAGRAAKHNITPLHVASKWGQLAMLDLLVEHGKFVGHPCIKRYTTWAGLLTGLTAENSPDS